MILPKEEKNPYIIMTIEKIRPIWTSVRPCVYMHSVVNGAIRLWGMPKGIDQHQRAARAKIQKHPLHDVK